MRVKLPEAPQSKKNPAQILHRDALSKVKMKEYADRKAYVTPSNIKEKGIVLVRHGPSRKSSGTPYDPKL